MAKKEENKEEKEVKSSIQEFIESPESLQNQISKTEEFVSGNQKPLLYAGIAIIAIIIGIYFYRSYSEGQSLKAQDDLAPAIHYYQNNELDLALDGDLTTPGFVKLASLGGKEGRLANNYAGLIYLSKKEYDKAISHLNNAIGSDLLVPAAIYSYIGDAYSGKKDYENAISYYQKAANYNPNEQFTPIYLIKLGNHQEVAGKYAEAVETYEKYMMTYFKHEDRAKVEKMQARAKQMANAK